MPNYYNFFKFLEKERKSVVPKYNRKIPLRVKLILAPQSDITKEDLYVNGNLLLDFCRISYLPDNLTVTGNIKYLYDTEVYELPENLTVGGTLSLDYTLIKFLPRSLKANTISCAHGHLSIIPDNFTIEGTLSLKDNNYLTELPENLTIGNSLIVNQFLKVLPKGLKIDGYLDISGCSRTLINNIPNDIQIGKQIKTSGKDYSEYIADKYPHLKDKLW